MASVLTNNLTTTFIYIMIRLYLDNPGIGEFTWEKIFDNLPKARLESNNRHVVFVKDNFKSNVANIMREARERNVYIVRVRGYYKIVNIKDVIERYHKRQGIAPPSFPQSATNKAIWGGSRVVGKEVER